MDCGREVEKGSIIFLTKLKDKETKGRPANPWPNMNKDKGGTFLILDKHACWETMLNPTKNYDVLEIETCEKIFVTHTLVKPNF